MSDVAVFCYHALSPTWSADLSVTPDAFERQVATLVRRGWSGATFTEAATRPVDGRTFAVTFDDAFASVKTYALPILRRLGVPATMFVPTRYVSAGAPLAWPGLDHWERTGDAAELEPLSWDDLGELAEHGWEIGSHTLSHPKLTTLADADLVAELVDSREECAQRMGRPPASIAYPYGDLDERVVDHTRAAGYEVAATMAWPRPPADALRVPRIGVYHADSWPRFSLKVSRVMRSGLGPRLLGRSG